MSNVTNLPMVKANLKTWGEHVGLTQNEGESVSAFKRRIRIKLTAQANRLDLEINGMYFRCEAPNPGQLMFFGMEDILRIRDLQMQLKEVSVHRPSTGWHGVCRFIETQLSIESGRETRLLVDIIWRDQ